MKTAILQLYLIFAFGLWLLGMGVAWLFGKRWIVIALLVPGAMAETNYLGCLTSTNAIALTGNPPFLIQFESLQTPTNIYRLLNHKESCITKDDLPAYMPPGLVRLTVSQLVGSETNVYTFHLPAPAPVARLTRRYPPMSPPMPESGLDGQARAKTVPLRASFALPGGTNSVYPRHRSQ